MIAFPGDKTGDFEADIRTELHISPGYGLSTNWICAPKSFSLHYERVYYSLMQQHAGPIVVS
jgi:hypothetical protein